MWILDLAVQDHRNGASELQVHVVVIANISLSP